MSWVAATPSAPSTHALADCLWSAARSPSMKPQNCDGESAPKRYRGLREPWKPGESGNPAGRPKGSRNKLGEEFITEIYNDWCQHGAAALKKVRETGPTYTSRLSPHCCRARSKPEFRG